MSFFESQFGNILNSFYSGFDDSKIFSNFNDSQMIFKPGMYRLLFFVIIIIIFLN